MSRERLTRAELDISIRQRGADVVLARDRATNLECRYLEVGDLRLLRSSFGVYGNPMLGSSQMYFFHLDTADNAIAQR